MRLQDHLKQAESSTFPFEFSWSDTQCSLVFDVRPTNPYPANRWVVEGTVALTQWLQREKKSGESDSLSAILIEEKATPDQPVPQIEALRSSLQGMMNSIAMDTPNIRLTTLRVKSDGLDSLNSTMEYLASEVGTYVTASTIDLRSA